MEVIEQSKSHFDEIWSILKKYDKRSGLFILKKDSLLTRTEKLHQKKWILHIFFSVFLLLSTMIVQEFSLFIVILMALNTQLNFAFHYALGTFMKNKNTIIHTFEWFQTIADPNQVTYFHPMIRKMVRDKIELQHRFAMKCIKYIGYFCQILFVLTFLVVLLPGKMHSKFCLPLPFFLPFKDQENWVSYGVTLLVQFLMTNNIVGYTISIASIFICLFLYFLFMLDIIKESVEMLGKELQVSDRDHIEFHGTCTRNRISLSTLAEINAETKSINMPLVQWLQIITDMLSDINQKVNLLNKMFSCVFLFIEAGSFCALTIFGLVMTIWKQQRIYASVINIETIFLFVFCWLNEKILERYEAIEEAFYKIPWYQLSPKDQKLILIAINCDKIQRGFTAMGIHDMTLERFSKIINAAYSNCLVLKDLIQN